MNERCRWVYPVVHHTTIALSIEQFLLAHACGADGVFLISHDDQNDGLFEVARAIKQIHPDWPVGINLLGVPALDALNRVVESGLDLVWTDNPGVSSAGWTLEGSRLVQRIKDLRAQRDIKLPLFFASVAFKYQPHEPEPDMAARHACSVGMLPTTSGIGTGSAPEVGKVKLMRAALCNGVNEDDRKGPFHLAVASGMTPENVQDYLAHVTHHLVATGVSTDMHHFDRDKLQRFIDTVHAFRGI